MIPIYDTCMILSASLRHTYDTSGTYVMVMLYVSHTYTIAYVSLRMWHLQSLCYFLWIRDIKFRFLPWSFSCAYYFLLPIDISNFYKFMLLFNLTTYYNLFSPYYTNVIYALRQCTLLACVLFLQIDGATTHARLPVDMNLYLWKSTFIAWLTLMFSITNF